MSRYAEIIYPPECNTDYPFKLAKYIYDRFILKYEKQNYSPKVLDIGCSTGRALKNFNNCGNPDLYGIDLRKEELPEYIKFKTCNIENEKLPFEDNFFDVVYSKSVLEHVINTENFVQESLRVLKPGGIFIGLTPDWESTYKIFWDDYTHVKPFTKKGLRDCLNIVGFSESECEIFYQLPFTWKSEYLKIIPVIVSFIFPDFLKWKTAEHRNGKDFKLIRFSKEKMLLSYGYKAEQ